MTDRLIGIRKKIKRADKHILEFEAAKLEFLETKPYRIVPQQNLKTGQWVHRVKSVADVPPDLSIIAGEAIHNLRSVLDHLVCQLILKHGGKLCTKSEFPISTKKATTKKDKAAFRAKIEGMSRKAAKAVRLLKPYKRGNCPLWKLHRLDIIDKHRLLLAVTSINKEVLVEQSLPSFGQAGKVTLMLEPKKMTSLKVGHVLFRHSGKDQLNPEFTFDIAFNEPGICKCEPALPLLNEFSDRVQAIVDNFAATLFS